MLGYLSNVGDVIDNQAEYHTDHTFNEAERAGSEWSFRCVNCRGCEKCHNLPNEIMSIKEQIKQQVIDDSINVGFRNNQSIAILILLMMSNPNHLAPNRSIALKGYNQ